MKTKYNPVDRDERAGSTGTGYTGDKTRRDHARKFTKREKNVLSPEYKIHRVWRWAVGFLLAAVVTVAVMIGQQLYPVIRRMQQLDKYFSPEGLVLFRGQNTVMADLDRNGQLAFFKLTDYDSALNDNREPVIFYTDKTLLPKDEGIALFKQRQVWLTNRIDAIPLGQENTIASLRLKKIVGLLRTAIADEPAPENKDKTKQSDPPAPDTKTKTSAPERGGR
jgi:hypothetical protein